jgi:hypothetical protein
MNGWKPLDWPFIRVVFPAILVIFTLLVSPAHAQVKGIATLKDYAGDIIVKNNGKWGTTYVKGSILYNGDKIVTRKGTAHVVFSDGSELNIEPNSNVRIMEEVFKRGFIFKQAVRQRRIRVLLGKTGYKEEFSKKRETQFEAPTAIAGLRGAEISFGVDHTGTAFAVIIEGNWYTLGDVIGGEAPELPPEIADNTPPQRSALVATEAAIQAAFAASRVSVAVEAAARADATAVDKLNKAQEKTKAAKAIIEQALAAAKEGKLEAEMMTKNPDPEVVREALEAINGSDSFRTAMTAEAAVTDDAVEETIKIVELAEKAIKEENAAGLEGTLEAANAESNVALAYAGVAVGNQAVLDARTAGGTEIAKAMEEKVGLATELAARLIEVTVRATLCAKKAAEATGDEAGAFAQAAKASASAASALRRVIQANTAGVVATVAGDTRKADEAFEASEEAAQAVDIALGLAQKATEAAEAGGLAQAMLAADSAELLEAKTDGLTEDVIQVPWEEVPPEGLEEAPPEEDEKPASEEGEAAPAEESYEQRHPSEED